MTDSLPEETLSSEQLQIQKAARHDKQRFIKLTMEGASCIVHPNELDSMLAGEELQTIDQSDVDDGG